MPELFRLLWTNKTSKPHSQIIVGCSELFPVFLGIAKGEVNSHA
jgi:hypothetical protein